MKKEKNSLEKNHEVKSSFCDEFLLYMLFFHLEKNPFDFSSNKNILTKREQEVINLILNGRLNKEIAYDLNISISTVEAHRARIMDKFHAKNLAHLIKIYLRIPDHYYK